MNRHNDYLWSRVTDVNAERSNQLYIQPKERSVEGCDMSNLPNFELENRLRNMYLINNRDVVLYRNQCNRDKLLSHIQINTGCKDYLYFRQRTRESYKTVDYRNNFALI